MHRYASKTARAGSRGPGRGSLKTIRSAAAAFHDTGTAPPVQGQWQEMAGGSQKVQGLKTAQAMADAYAAKHPYRPQAAAPVVQKVSKEWMQSHGCKTRGDVIDKIEALFKSGDINGAHALLNEYNELTPNKYQKIQTKDVPGYVEPANDEDKKKLIAASGERRYFTDEDVHTGDLVYGRSESRDRYVDSKTMNFNVIDDLNNQFIGTQGGNMYGHENVPAKNLQSLKTAGDFREFLENFKPQKGPDKTPGGDELSINKRLRRASKYGIVFTRYRNNKIRFVLDGITQDEVVNKTNRHDKVNMQTGEKIRAITGTELRQIYRYRHDANIMSGIEFYNDGHKMDTAPWELNPELWSSYVPKGERDAKHYIIRGIELNIYRAINSMPNEALKKQFRPYAREYVMAYVMQFDHLYQQINMGGLTVQDCDGIVQYVYHDFIRKIGGA